MSNQAASTFCSTALVFLTALLTGIGVFDRIGQYAGAGAFVPISGFANAHGVRPAMEFRREGMVLGLGRKAVYPGRSGIGLGRIGVGDCGAGLCPVAHVRGCSP